MSGAAAFPVVRIAGDGATRGRQYGEQARDRINATLEIYLPAFAARGLDWPRVRELAGRFGEQMAAYDAELVEEIDGIARGAALELEHIVALNARTELLYWQDDGCTAVCCLPEVTADGHTLLAQNWDWRPACRESAIVLECRPTGGPAFITFVEAGLLARSGLNEAGIGVAGNFLQSDQDFGRGGVPIPLIRRRILTSSSLADAVGEVVRAPRAFSSNHLIAHAPGEAIDCEAAPADVYFLEPEAGVLSHSNHFRSPAALARLRDTGIARYPDTLYRHSRLERAVRGAAPRVTPDDIKAALQDHYGLPDAVCRHPAPRPDGTTIATVASVVMDLNAGQLSVAPGPPCEHPYVEHEISEVAHAL